MRVSSSVMMVLALIAATMTAEAAPRVAPAAPATRVTPATRSTPSTRAPSIPRGGSRSATASDAPAIPRSIKVTRAEIPPSIKITKTPNTIVLGRGSDGFVSVPAPPPLDSPQMQAHQSLGLPTTAKAASNAMVLGRNGFVSIYDPDRKVPLVVSWSTKPEDLRVSGSGPNIRTNAFHQDLHLPPNVPQPTLADYRNSGYDRGHMVAQAERPIGIDSDANNATYSLINIIPQARNNNSGSWSHLEDFCRTQIVDGKKTAYVQAGPIFEGRPKTIGDGVAVPSHLYKIVVLADEGVDLAKITTADIGKRVKVFGVIIPNNDNDVKQTDHWANFVVPVSEITTRTKLSGFLSGLPDDVRKSVLARKPDVKVVPKAEGTAYMVSGMLARTSAAQAASPNE